MAIDALVKPFLSLPLFRGLKPLQLSEIVRRAERIVYKPGDYIITEDQQGDAAIVIVAGECVRISGDNHGKAGEAVPEGSLVGEMAMLVEAVHTSSIIARSAVRALRLTREDMHRLMTEEPEIAVHFSLLISARLQQIADELKSIDKSLANIASLEMSLGRQPASRQSMALH